MLATSHDSIELKTPGSTMWWMTWQAWSVRPYDAVDAIIGAHFSVADGTAAAAAPWALNATHPLLLRLLHEIHMTARGGDPEGPGCGTHSETEPGLLHLTRCGGAG